MEQERKKKEHFIASFNIEQLFTCRVRAYLGVCVCEFTIVHLWSRWMPRWHVYLTWARTTCHCWHRNCRHVSAAASSSWASRSGPRSKHRNRSGPLSGRGPNLGASPPGWGSPLQMGRIVRKKKINLSITPRSSMNEESFLRWLNK